MISAIIGCIPTNVETVSILFWLGFCSSARNPPIIVLKVHFLNIVARSGTFSGLFVSLGVNPEKICRVQMRHKQFLWMDLEIVLISFGLFLIFLPRLCMNNDVCIQVFTCIGDGTSYFLTGISLIFYQSIACYGDQTRFYQCQISCALC